MGPTNFTSRMPDKRQRPDVTVVDKTNIDVEIEKARKADFLAL